MGATHSERTIVFMKTVVVKLLGPKGGKVECVAYLDEGSSVTLMSGSLASELGVDNSGLKCDLKLQTLNGPKSDKAEKLSVFVQNVGTGNKFKLNDVYSIKELPLGDVRASKICLKNLFPQQEEYNLPYSEDTPRILIGLDHADLIAAREIVPLGKNGPYLQRTRLGWRITGKAVVNDVREPRCKRLSWHTELAFKLVRV